MKIFRRLAEWILRIVTNRFFAGWVLASVYFTLLIGYVKWCMGNADGLEGLIKVVIFVVIISLHRSILNFIDRVLRK